MKLAWIAAALLATLGCEKEPSKLDKIASDGRTVSEAAASGDLETRVARLEKKLAKVDREALEFLAMAWEQRLEQETRAQPGVVYGVDIAQNVALGQVEGSPEALVTIVEAWDFA
ncbi:MAG TPA: hypothetical protein VK932_21580 [Kofleriaceae bacterium]|nr:hypothetical protein [Kofleriaceae bacterium]